VLYTADLQAVVERYGLSPHFYADDSQICSFCRPGDVGTLSQRLVDCVDDVALWIRSYNRLQLNVNKIDQHWCITSRRLSQFPAGPLTIGGCNVVPPQSLWNLLFDADLSLDFCNSVAFGLPAGHLRRLQAIQNAAARLFLSLRRTEHISDALMCVRWLNV
jgi:hypothetical protein